VSEIISLIKNMESFTPKFRHIVNYNPFKIQVPIQKNEQVNIKNVSVIKKELKLYAIFQNKVNINGKWLKTGDYIEGYKVIKISENEVLLTKNGKIKKIALKANLIKVAK
jgi:hypothetical protein